MSDLVSANATGTLSAKDTRTRAARWVLLGCLLISATGVFLHVILRGSRGIAVNWTYLTMTLTIGVSAFAALQFVSRSLHTAMRIMYLGGTVAVCGMVIRALSDNPQDPLSILVVFPAGVFAWGLILGFRAAFQYAVVSAGAMVLIGIVFNAIGPTFVYAVVSFIFIFPARVVEQLIDESTAEQARMNTQLREEIHVRQQVETELRQHRGRLEEMVQERTAQLESVNEQLQEEVAVRRQAEESLRDYADELEERNEELDAYAHTVAHDLKNPLAAVIGFADMLEIYYAPSADETQRQCITAISQYGRKMNNLVQELLLLAGVRKMDEIPMAPLDTAKIVSEAIERLAVLHQESRAEIEVQDEWPMVTSYAPWVEEVWVNYISNGIKYGGKPPHLVLGANEGADPETGRPVVSFWVRDNGPGLTAEERASLFTPFTQLHQVDLKGHGLGLSIVHRIVSRLGGQVDVQSHDDQGSTFSFTLPVTVPSGETAPVIDQSILQE